MPTITVNRADYFYSRSGRPGAAPLLLLHGFTGSSASWRPLIGDFGDRFDIVAVDLLGHGKTDSPAQPDRYAMHMAAQDIVDLAKRLELNSFHLLGYSMGGRLALYVAVHFPQFINSLILESASPGIMNSDERQRRHEADQTLAEAIDQQSIGQFIDKWEELPLFDSQKAVPAERRELLRKQRLQNNRSGLANSLRGMGTGIQPSLWGSLPSLQAQTLLICGELDAKFVSINNRMAQDIPDATFRLVPRAGHNVHFERPKVFGSLVSDFIGQAGAF